MRNNGHNTSHYTSIICGDNSRRSSGRTRSRASSGHDRDLDLDLSRGSSRSLVRTA